MHLHVYKLADLTLDQRQFLADFWSRWECRRRRLDEELVAPLQNLNRLPTCDDIPEELVDIVALVSSGHNMDKLACQRRCVLETASIPVLLGTRAELVVRANAACTMLLKVHQRDAEQMEEVLEAFARPTWYMNDIQRIKSCSAHIEYTTVTVDTLMLCQIAAVELRRTALYNTGGNGS
jgi:hypothetical protein